MTKKAALVLSSFFSSELLYRRGIALLPNCFHWHMTSSFIVFTQTALLKKKLFPWLWSCSQIEYIEVHLYDFTSGTLGFRVFWENNLWLLLQCLLCVKSFSVDYLCHLDSFMKYMDVDQDFNLYFVSQWLPIRWFSGCINSK